LAALVSWPFARHADATAERALGGGQPALREVASRWRTSASDAGGTWSLPSAPDFGVVELGFRAPRRCHGLLVEWLGVGFSLGD
jgi:hypothetical protein